MRNYVAYTLLCVIFLTISGLMNVCAKDTAVQTDQKSELVKITLKGTDQMQFDKKEINIKKGSKVELTFKHDGKLPVNIMGHNFVLLNQGVDLVKFATEAMKGKDSGYVLPEQAKDVIAQTNLIGGGQSTTITFDAPKPGVYDFLCTFPGHYAMMKGKFIVK